MNDRYQFRAKRIDSGEWITGYYAHHVSSCGSRHMIYAQPKDPDDSDGSHEIDPATICQCSGLKGDKLIFENDIIMCCGRIGAVRFCEYSNFGWTSDEYGFYIEWHDEEKDTLRKDFTFWLKKQTFSVIGNTYDDDELLGGAK